MTSHITSFAQHNMYYHRFTEVGALIKRPDRIILIYTYVAGPDKAIGGPWDRNLLGAPTYLAFTSNVHNKQCPLAR